MITTHLVLDYGWGEQIIGYFGSVYHAMVTIVSVPAGILARKVGCRFTYGVGAVVGGTVYLLMGLLPMTPALYLFLGLFAGISIAMGGVVTAPILIANWFERRKTFPLALVMTDGSLGGFFVLHSFFRAPGDHTDLQKSPGG